MIFFLAAVTCERRRFMIVGHPDRAPVGHSCVGASEIYADVGQIGMTGLTKAENHEWLVWATHDCRRMTCHDRQQSRITNHETRISLKAIQGFLTECCWAQSQLIVNRE